MRFQNIVLLGATLLVAACQTNSMIVHPPLIVPQPNSIEVVQSDKPFEFTSQTRWVAPSNDDIALVCQPLLDAFERVAGFEYELCSERDETSAAVVIDIDTELAPEQYKLAVGSDGISISASTANGVFYALQSIRQMLPEQIEGQTLAPDMGWRVPAVMIDDTPKYAYRGFMLDVSRTFLEKERVMEIIDVMGLLKLNKLQFHFIDDNGWRLQIDKYPLLTEVGAWRVERDKFYSAREAAQPGEPTPIGGYYTKEDMREIIAYATQRAVEIIPEIEMPGHSMAAIASYPELACDTKGRFVGVLPGFTGTDNYTPTMCTSKEFVYEFLTDVIDEVAELFPSQYIHIGGDEADPRYWAECPRCQKLMKQKGYKKLHDLQSDLLMRVNTHIQSKGKVMVGWDEIAETQIPEDAVVVGWRGDGLIALKAAEQGHNFIMAPAKSVYLIRYQGPQWFEPRTYFGNNTLLDVYNFEPLPEGTDQKIVDLMLGTQACLWSEFTEDHRDAQYLIFPRLCAFAESAWTENEYRDWAQFLPRLDRQLTHFEQLNINYARSMFNLDHKILPTKQGEGLSVEISSIRPDLEIRYTMNNEEPTASDDLFSDKIEVKESTTIMAATFKGGEKMGQTLTLPINFNKATASMVKSSGGSNLDVGLLVNGLRGSEDRPSDFEWCGWYNRDGWIQIDLNKTTDINNISIGMMVDEVLSSGLVRTLKLSHSTDGENFTPFATKSFNDAQIFEQTTAMREAKFEGLDFDARYIKIEFENPGQIPQGRTRAGQPTWIYFDEIMIN